MVDCSICLNKDSSKCDGCRFGAFFERTVVSDKLPIAINTNPMFFGSYELCGHCGFPCDYASCFRQFYCVKCGGLNTRTISEFED